jgi:CRISP-associated protein Cas1
MSATPAAPAADFLPARMLNEFVYCPRLFFYEHVEGVFVHNADTKRGAAQHERLDSGSGQLPPPAEADKESAPPIPAETIHSRSVMLGSETLGVVAKLDLVEVTVESVAVDEPGGGAAAKESRVRTIPVEYKAGAPREGEEGRALWDTDRIQLGLQMLLLRGNGYLCDEGVVFYRETRQRVRFTLDEETEAWIRRTIAAARTCTTSSIPSPLEHSPKCPRCSLVSVCLPDETNLLRERPDAECLPAVAQLALPGLGIESDAAIDTTVLAEALGSDDPAWETLPEPRLPQPAAEGDVRRLIASDFDAKALYVNTPGVSVTRKGDTVVVKEHGETLAEVHIKDLHHLAIFGSAQLSTALVQTLCERDVPISYFSMGGWFYGLTRGHGLSNVFTRIRQFARAGDADQALPLARLFVYGKIRNQRTLLMRNHIEPPPLALRALKHAASAALTVGSHSSLLGIEGAAAMHYFQNFGGMIKVPDEQDDLPGLEESVVPAGKTDGQTTFTFDFKTRNRRPPRDPVNALLSMAYSLLARDCTIAAYAVGFDPYIGLFHQPRFGRPALALDMMEEFRPLIADSAVLTAINNRMVTPDDFVQAGDAVNLSAAGRKRFLFAYEKRMSDIVTHPVFDYKVSYRRAIELQFRLLARTLTGEIQRYMPFMTR